MNYDLFVTPAATDVSYATSGRVSRQAARVQMPAGVGSPSQYSDNAALNLPGTSASDQLTTEDISNSVAAFNDVFEQADVGVRYRVDRDTNDLVISLVDRNTDKVIRQIPPDQILKMRQRLEELMGLILDTSA